MLKILMEFPWIRVKCRQNSRGYAKDLGKKEIKKDGKFQGVLIKLTGNPGGPLEKN